MRPRNTLPILLAAALGCQAAPPPDTAAEAKQAIDAANATWARLTAAGHADSLAQYYHPNAMTCPRTCRRYTGATRSARSSRC